MVNYRLAPPVQLPLPPHRRTESLSLAPEPIAQRSRPRRAGLKHHPRRRQRRPRSMPLAPPDHPLDPPHLPYPLRTALSPPGVITNDNYMQAACFDAVIARIEALPVH